MKIVSLAVSGGGKTTSKEIDDQIELTPEGISVLKFETHMNKWVRDCHRLDHDQFLIPFACQYIKPGTVVIDVGAFIGDHTIAYLRAAGADGIVCAYEMNPVAFECLKRNCPKALHFNCAVGDKCGRVSYHLEPGNFGASHLSEHGEKETIITTLDHDFRELLDPLGWKTVSLIKIDVEGTEVQVLKGADKLITKYRPHLLIEINHLRLKSMGYSHLDVCTFLSNHDYRVQFVPDHATWDTEQFDILAIPI